MSRRDVAEYRARLARAQAGMEAAGLGALLLTTEAEFRYFSGFLTGFWESPSREWFLVIPATGDPVALLADVLREAGGPVGVPSGAETHLRMPLADFARLKAAMSGLDFTDDRGIIAGLRAVKSEAETACIARACAAAGRAFDRVGEIAEEGVPLDAVFRDFQRLLLEEGADFVPYLVGGAGPEGYTDVISPAGAQALKAGDVLMLDTGAVCDGYFCDFDRNFAIGHARAASRAAHARLTEAVQTGMAAARPGARACDVWLAMADIVGAGNGRLGHGLGMQVTEGLSLRDGDATLLVPGMVITLEPVIATAPGRIMVHEEVIAITDGAPRALSPLAGPELPVIG